ncbi:MAG: chorismate synthase [Clostridia bacterium]|nr:chorismate synthase [Clostridia bacterium]
MKNTFGNSISVTLFGESHGKEIGAVLDGIAPGIYVDEEFISSRLDLRRPWGKISTQRSETDNFRIVSGVFKGYTTGAPICIVIPNKDTDSSKYDSLSVTPRPGHADYTAYCKYHGFQDHRGGGHFSGRITAPLVAAGAILLQALKAKGINIGTHIYSIGQVMDSEFDNTNLNSSIDKLNSLLFAVLNEEKGVLMQEEISKAAKDGDSIGGILETAVTGIPAGVGEPWFDTAEGVLSHALFSVPGIKGVEFGAGFSVAQMKGSECNDNFRFENGTVVTDTNNNGGINGGITNGMPLTFRVAVKPTPSIFAPQNTVDLKNRENTVLSLTGRHDPCIVHRARAVVDSVTAIALADLLCTRFGTDWLKGE